MSSRIVVCRSHPRRIIIGLAAAASLVTACSSDTSPSGPREVDGTAVTVGNGTARSYELLGANGAAAIGVKLTATALDGLPAADTEWALPLPAGTVAPYDHVTLDWNAQGHPPAVYQLPHFDFHFYIVSPTEQAAIQGGPDTTTVPTQYVPKDYASGVMAVPDMGVHWVDTLSAEFQGQTFDKTLIYGFYHGSMVFVEPMITRDFLASRPAVTAPVKQPQAFQKHGAYPVAYSVRYDATDNTVRVELDSLTAR